MIVNRFKYKPPLNSEGLYYDLLKVNYHSSSKEVQVFALKLSVPVQYSNPVWSTTL